MIKFDLRTIVDMISQLTENLSTDVPKEIIHPIKEKNEQPEDNVLPTFPLKNWEQFCEMENLLHTNTVASRQLVSLLLIVSFIIAKHNPVFRKILKNDAFPKQINKKIITFAE